MDKSSGTGGRVRPGWGWRPGWKPTACPSQVISQEPGLGRPRFLVLQLLEQGHSACALKGRKGGAGRGPHSYLHVARFGRRTAGSAVHVG